MMREDGFSLPSAIKGFAQEPTPNPNPNPNPTTNPAKRKRNLPGTPDPDAEVIALSPKSLMATNRFICEICNKGFQREQNLQLHRRGHNLPWKLKQRTNKEAAVRKKVYICPEKNCVHHDPSRALGDLTGVKKHYSRKHGEKKWKCEKCSKKYAVQSDWKAHSKICGTREYRCDCGTLFSRKDSFITHRAFCDALAEESARFTSVPAAASLNANFRSDFINRADNSNLQATGFFSSAFRPEFAGSELMGNNLNVDGQKSKLPIWLDHANSHQLNTPIGVIFNATDGNTTNLLATSSSSCFPDNQLVQTTVPAVNMFGSMMEAQWLNRSYQEAPFTGANLSMTSALPQGLKEDQDQNKRDLSASVTSLYSHNQNRQKQAGQLAHMSATALLQKAAQMGSTRSKPGSNNSSTGTTALMSSSREFLGGQPNEAENLNELMNYSLSSSTPSNIMNEGSLFGDSNSSSFFGSDKKMKEVERSLTRDFLGVGGDANRPLLQQGLAKYTSLGSTGADLIQYSTGYH